MTGVIFASGVIIIIPTTFKTRGGRAVVFELKAHTEGESWVGKIELLYLSFSYPFPFVKKYCSSMAMSD